MIPPPPPPPLAMELQTISPLQTQTAPPTNEDFDSSKVAATQEAEEDDEDKPLSLGQMRIEILKGPNPWKKWWGFSALLMAFFMYVALGCYYAMIVTPQFTVKIKDCDKSSYVGKPYPLPVRSFYNRGNMTDYDYENVYVPSGCLLGPSWILNNVPSIEGNYGGVCPALSVADIALSEADEGKPVGETINRTALCLPLFQKKALSVFKIIDEENLATYNYASSMADAYEEAFLNQKKLLPTPIVTGIVMLLLFFAGPFIFSKKYVSFTKAVIYSGVTIASAATLISVTASIRGVMTGSQFLDKQSWQPLFPTCA